MCTKERLDFTDSHCNRLAFLFKTEFCKVILFPPKTWDSETRVPPVCLFFPELHFVEINHCCFNRCVEHAFLVAVLLEIPSCSLVQNRSLFPMLLYGDFMLKKVDFFAIALDFVRENNLDQELLLWNRHDPGRTDRSIPIETEFSCLEGPHPD